MKLVGYMAILSNSIVPKASIFELLTYASQWNPFTSLLELGFHILKDFLSLIHLGMYHMELNKLLLFVVLELFSIFLK